MSEVTTHAPAPATTPDAVATTATAVAPSSLLGAAPAATTPTSNSQIRFFGDAVAKDGQFVEGWTENLQQIGLSRLANKAALAKDETTLLRSLDDALGLVGKKAGIAYPKAGADDTAIAAYRADAGVPDSPEAYNLKPEQLPAGLEWSDDTAAAYAKTLHQHHIPQAAASELVALHLQQQAEASQQAHSTYQLALTQQVQAAAATFQKEWGQDYDSRLEANRAYVGSVFSPEELQQPALQAALSHPALVRVIDSARRALREAPLPGVGHEATSHTHSARQQAIEIMTANPGWKSNPDLHKRVTDLYALDASQSRRRR